MNFPKIWRVCIVNYMA